MIRENTAKLNFEERKSTMTRAGNVDSEPHDRKVDVETHVAVVFQLKSAIAAHEELSTTCNTLQAEKSGLAMELYEANRKILILTTKEVEKASAYLASPNPSCVMQHQRKWTDDKQLLKEGERTRNLAEVDTPFKDASAYNRHAHKTQTAKGGPLITP